MTEFNKKAYIEKLVKIKSGAGRYYIREISNKLKINSKNYSVVDIRYAK